MTYQVIAGPRTGSCLLNSFALEDNGLGFHEYFLEDIDINLNWHRKLFIKYSIEERLEFLEYYKSKDIHFSFKFFPHQALEENPELENRFIDFFKDYKNLTIHRDPWESLLSLAYQHHTKWETSHNWDHKGIIDLDEYEIDLTLVQLFVKMYKINEDFASKINVHKKFNYEEITIENLQKFFNTSFTPRSKPMGLDYKSKAINIKEAREIFDYEMHGTRNWNNN